jgi:hypothetical protein
MDLEPDLEKDRDFAKLLQNGSQFEMEWKGQISTAEVHEVIQGLLDISVKYKKPNLKTTAGMLYKKYYAETVGTQVSFFKTPYYELFQNEALPNVREAISLTGKQLDNDLDRMKAKLKAMKAEFKWPHSAKFRESINLFVAFVDSFVAVVPKMKLLAEFEEVLLKEVKDEKAFNLDYLEKQLAAIESKKTLRNMLDIAQSMVKEFEIPLDKESLEKFDEGRNLYGKIEQIKDEVTAFSAIVAVWLLLGAQEREQYFTPISAALYKFLNSKKDSELKCLVERTCSGFLDSIVRDWAILPQIKKHGVEKIKITLNEKTHGYVLAILEERLLAVITNLDARITKKVMKNVVKAKEKLDAVRRNAQGFTKEKFLVWLKENMDLNDDITMGYEFSDIQVDIQKRLVNFVIPEQSKNVISAQVLGASLGSNAKVLETDILTEKKLRRIVLEQVNKVMGFGGLPIGARTTVGIVRNFENEPEPFDVGKAVNSILSYGLPDKVHLAGPYARKEAKDPITASALAQVELGQGLLSLMQYLRDWHPNSFDNLLGKYKASDIFGGEGTGGSDPILFSKTDFFGMVTAQFLTWISNLNKGYSQIALVSDSNELVWLNEYAKNKDKKVLFGIYTDIVSGQRASEVHLVPMVKLIRILKSVQEVVNGIEKTKFKELLKKDESDPACRNPQVPACPTYAQVIAKQVDEIKKVMLPLGNTIATKFRKQKEASTPGLALGKIKLPALEYFDVEPALMDQLLVIEALVNVYESTKIESYLWAAKETYTLMQKYYNPKSNFFEMDAKIATVPIIVQMLRSFMMIQPYLDETEKNILAEKLKIWEYSLERLQ